MKQPYKVPAQMHQCEWLVSNSRFITSVGYAPTVESAKAFITTIRNQMPDASHHVYAYRIGFGNSVIEGMSDDGEPTGTAGPPTLAVLRGRDIGDVVVVTTRYFGGTKLGSGGLVRAYTQSCQQALSTLPTILNIPQMMLTLQLPYRYYDAVKKTIQKYEATITSEHFEASVTLMIQVPEHLLEPFSQQLTNVCQGDIKIQKRP